MTELELLNDPEYRWYHKEEMSKIMPFTSERIRLGMVVIDYTKLRHDNSLLMKERAVHNFNFNNFKKLIDIIPTKIKNPHHKKTGLQPADRLHFEKRDLGVCFVCESVFRYGSNSSKRISSHLHHIIPNGNTSDDNICTLCTHCHQMIHLALYASGKWKYARPQ